MIVRQATKIVQEALDYSPAVAVLGPRQVGKTTLALEIARHRPSVYLDLESPADCAKLDDPEDFLPKNADKLIILDEVHRLPRLFPILRGLIDKGRRAGRKSGQYLLLGSASLDLLQQAGESLAGRIEYIELPVLQGIELPPKDMDTLWLRGGFPESFLAPSDESSMRWRAHFIQTYLEREIPQFGFRIPASSMRPFWTMLAHEQACTLNASALANNLDASYQTISRYIDLLADLLLVRKLLPWHSNTGKRLIKAPKVFFRDSGIVHALLGIRSINDLFGHSIIGRSWEAFVLENIVQACPFGVESYFYRSSGGAEVDLVLHFPSGEKWAIEIKRSMSPKLSRGFYEACKDICPQKRYIVYAGKESFTISDGIEVIALHQLVDMLKLKGDH